MFMFTRTVRSRSVVANRCAISASQSTRLERGTMTSRMGFSWSDSSRKSSTMGSFFARICPAICSSTLLPETCQGSSGTMISPSSLRQPARSLSVPLPLS